MGNIITIDKQAREQCMGEINGVLAKYGKVLSPKLTMTTGGISFTIEVVDMPETAPLSPTGGMSRGGK